MANDARSRRELLGLSQTDAAIRAGVSLATWRRFESGSAQVKPSTRTACERVLDRQARDAYSASEAASDRRMEKVWHDSPFLTPRQASVLSGLLGWWADELDEWVERPSGPLHRVPPLQYLDIRVMILVNESRAWADALRLRCLAVVKEIDTGILPFDRPGCFADELLIALALAPAAEDMKTHPELTRTIAPRTTQQHFDVGGDETADWVTDHDWNLVELLSDDRCQWDQWQVAVKGPGEMLTRVLSDHHPSTWFDPGMGSGPGYLQRLAGMTDAL